MISRETELYLKGMRLSPEDAEMLEDALNQDASNTKMRIQLIAYYYNRLAQSKTEEDTPESEKADAARAHQTHVHWITVNEPNHSVLSKSWAQLEH